jgi:hypothetical protein
MFSFSFARARQVFSAFFLPNPTTMASNPFALLHNPGLNLETDFFLFLHWAGVTSNPASGAEQALTRFLVKTIRVNKKNAPPEHEFIVIEVRDSQEHRDTGKKFVLERTVNMDSDKPLPENTVDGFFQHLDCKKLLDALIGTLQAIPPTALAAGAAVGAAAAAGLTLSGLPGLSLPQALTASAVTTLSMASSYLGTNQSSESVVDNVSLTVFQFLHFMSDLAVSRQASNSFKKPKPPKDAQADDHWLAGFNAETPKYRIAREVQTF